GVDRVAREAYSHEVNSAGFWFGDDTVAEPAFYCYTAPAPKALTSALLVPSAAKWFDFHGTQMALLPYEDVRRSKDPHATLLSFLQSAYEAGANLAAWDRAALEGAPPQRGRSR